MNTVANTAFSLTLSGNSGISPFLTMAIIGVAGKIFPDNLPLEPTSTCSRVLLLCSSLSFDYKGQTKSYHQSHIIEYTISSHHHTALNLYIISGKDYGILARDRCLVFGRDT